MNCLARLISSTLICISLAACEGTPIVGADAGAPADSSADAGALPSDAGALPDDASHDAFNGSVLGTAACADIAARAAECLPEYASSCTQDAFRAGCERVIVDWSRLRPIRLCVASGPCVNGIFDTECVDNIQSFATPAPSIDSVIEVLCDACPGAAAAYADEVSTPAQCRAYVGAAIDGTGTSFRHRALHDRYVLLAEDQLIEIRDCIAASPSCDAFLPEECGQRFRDMDMVLAPGVVVPECL